MYETIQLSGSPGRAIWGVDHKEHIPLRELITSQLVFWWHTDTQDLRQILPIRGAVRGASVISMIQGMKPIERIRRGVHVKRRWDRCVVGSMHLMRAMRR